MPYLNVQILTGSSNEQKENLISGVTKVVQEVLGSKPESTFVVVQEVERENWGVGGKSIQSILQNAK
jgi:4-oxalocrotonate tautomerase